MRSIITIVGLVTCAAWSHAGTSIEQAPNDPMEICAVMPGETVPAAQVVTPSGEEVDLAAMMAGKPTVLLFYRGGWCPYCSRHLAEIGTMRQELMELGYQILALSPDRPEKLQEAMKESPDASYQLLSDSAMNAAMAMGIAFRVEDTLVERYRTEYNIDLEGDSGQTHHLLPVPAAFIVDGSGTIRFAYVNPDYKTRIDAGVLRAAAKAALAE